MDDKKLDSNLIVALLAAAAAFFIAKKFAPALIEGAKKALPSGTAE